MKKLAILALSLALVGCNTDGFKELPTVYMRDHGGGGSKGLPIGGNNPSNPVSTDNTNSSNWTYKTVSNESGVFSATATNYSTNSYKMSEYPSLDGNSFVNLERYRTYPTGAKKRVVVFTDSEIACTPSCKVTVRGENIQEMTMTNSIKDAITGIDDATNTALYDLFASGGTVQVEMPLLKDGKFNAQFNARGFDPEQMKLSGEGGKVPSSTNP